MSRYESLSGNGLLMKKDIRELKKALIEAHNKQLESVKREHGLKPSQLTKMGLKKATSRTTNFAFWDIEVDEEFPVRKNAKPKKNYYMYEEGWLSLNMDVGSFKFSTDYNNHTVERISDSSHVYWALMRFLQNLEIKGNKYGATTYYRNEYDRDCHDNPSEGTREAYGGWVPNNLRKTKIKTKRRAI